jgi:hypothetical protein
MKQSQVQAEYVTYCDNAHQLLGNKHKIDISRHHQGNNNRGTE